MTILRNSNCDKSQKLKLWPNWRKIKLWQNPNAQIVTKLKSSNCDKTQKLNLWRKKTLKLKFLHNSNYYKTQKLKLWQNSQTQYVLVKTTWHLQNRWDFSGQLFAISRCFVKTFVFKGPVLRREYHVLFILSFGAVSVQKSLVLSLGNSFFHPAFQIFCRGF